MQIVYANQEPPAGWESAIFLAGPTPRDAETSSWRPEALRILAHLGFRGVVFVPEAEGGVWKHNYDDQIEWEEKCLNLADVILFWVPRELTHMPGYTTNVEWGFWMGRDPLRLVLGYPKDAPRMRYLDYYAQKLHIPIAHDLLEVCSHAKKKTYEAFRINGERAIPAHLWRTRSFQTWYEALRIAGNTLRDARVEWVGTSTLKPGRAPVVYAIRPWLHCGREDRIKSNETVVFRTGICSVALVRKKPDILDSEVVTIREFRVAGANQRGFVHELPGGSSVSLSAGPVEVAHEECSEEVGLTIAHERFIRIEYRQQAPTLSAHGAILFRVDATDEELDFVRNITLPTGVLNHGRTGVPVAPKTLTGQSLTLGPDDEPREVLAEWMTSESNPYFAKVMANRVWAELMGQGLVDPVDDLRATNPASNEPLLDYLATDFRQHRYDIKHLIRRIMTSHVFELSSNPSERNVSDIKNFSRYYRQRLRAEVLLDAVNDVLGQQEEFAAMPPGSRAAQLWTHRAASQFLDTFGRPDPNQDPPCERTTDFTTPQVLHLMNSPALNKKLSLDTAQPARLAASDLTNEQLVEEVFLRVYCRPPTTAEMTLAHDTAVWRTLR